MFRCARLSVALALLVGISSVVSAQAIPRDIRLQILETVVQIVPFDAAAGESAPWSGSGTIISPDGHILTNYHVIGDLDTRSHYEWHAILVTDPAFTDQPPQFAYWARYVASDPTHDLAILEIVEYADETPVPDGTVFPSVAVGDSNTLLPGDPIVIVGYPGISGSTVTFTSGTMSGWVGEDFETGGKQWIKTDAKIAHGNSGGAAFNLQGALIGVPTAGRTIQYDALDVEEQAYVRPIGLAWALIGPNVATVRRAVPAPAATTATLGQPSGAPPASPPTNPLGADADAGQPSGEYGALVLGEAHTSRLAGASDEGFAFHGYQVAVPAGTGRVVVSVDGRGNDLDLAVSNGTPITDYDSVEHLDTSQDPNPRYTLDAPADTVYVDVLNLFGTPVDYTVRVDAEGAAAGAGDAATGTAIAPLQAPSRGASMVGSLELGQMATGEIEGLDGVAPYHTYWVDAPAGTPQVVVRMTADRDLDLAVNVGDQIDTYTAEGNWDFLDDSTSAVAEFVIPSPAGRIYIDVFNALGPNVTGSYTLFVR